MSLIDLLVTTVQTLEAEGIPYMVTGSIASSFHGEPRATRDIDVVIDPRLADLDCFVEQIRDQGIYVDPEAARAALRDRGQFNAVAGDSKVDFIVRKDRPFSKTEFGRRRRVQLPDVDAYIVSVEDLVVTKLEWAFETGSDRHLRDVEGMLKIAGKDLDRNYVDGWTRRLGLAEAWGRVLAGLEDA